MTARKLMSWVLVVGSFALFAAAASRIDVPPVVWDPGGPARVGLGFAGLLALAAAHAVGRGHRTPG